MFVTESLAVRLRLIRPSSIHPLLCRRCFATTQKWAQRIPLGAYYESILHDQTRHTQAWASKDYSQNAPLQTAPSESTTGSSAKADGTTKTPLDTSVSFDTSPPSPPSAATAEDKARIIFGSRILGPAEQRDRLAEKEARSTYIAGVLVPPRPEEPDNCCMSGCVSCVWDRFGEELEEWTTKNREAEEKLEAMSATKPGRRTPKTQRLASIGRDKLGDVGVEDAFSSVPVGFREFMKMEKRLREKHEMEGTVG